jgi:mannan endo-1,4-beta-mannosidase
MKKLCCILLLSTSIISLYAQHQPVNANASPEAKKLLAYLYSISGKKTLSGMHNVLGRMSVSTDSVHIITGNYPAIWGGDFGFADSTHDIDNIKYRPLLVGEIKKQHDRGAIIVMSYHQANPFIGEPCQFEGGIISKLTDDQWKEILTKGTPLYEKWRKQMDLFAGYLQQLNDAHIPIIFRPYHEMNGDWFWWCGRKGPGGFIALWDQLYNYYTKEKHLDNLLWAWTPDKPWPDVADYYPGDATVDLLGCDIYPIKGETEVYPQAFYDRMYKLAHGKPLALTEQSVLPTTEQLQTQPWTWFMSWGGMLFNDNKVDDIRKVYNSEKVIRLPAVK